MGSSENLFEALGTTWAGNSRKTVITVKYIFEKRLKIFHSLRGEFLFVAYGFYRIKARSLRGRVESEDDADDRADHEG